jgi:hypothetical protein
MNETISATGTTLTTSNLISNSNAPPTTESMSSTLSSELVIMEEINNLVKQIKSHQQDIFALRKRADEKRKSLKHLNKLADMDNIKTPFLVRDVYVFTYYWRGVYANQHAIFYGLPKETEYKVAIEKLGSEPKARKMKIPSSCFNTINPIKVSYTTCFYSKTLEPIYEWNEPLRKDTDPALSSIDKSVIYLVGDYNEKSDYEVVLGVFTDAKKLAAELMKWIDGVIPMPVNAPFVNLHLVQGNEARLLTFGKANRFDPTNYPSEYIPTIIAMKTQELLHTG